jgi:hypothetical protein
MRSGRGKRATVGHSVALGPRHECAHQLLRCLTDERERSRRSSRDETATVGVEGLAGHPPACVRSEEDGYGGDVVVGIPTRRKGLATQRRSMCSRVSAGVQSSPPAVLSVSQSGQIVFTRMLSAPHSRATTRVSARTAPFDAALPSVRRQHLWRLPSAAAVVLGACRERPQGRRPRLLSSERVCPATTSAISSSVRRPSM